jgi:purine nucleoside permease
MEDWAKESMRYYSGGKGNYVVCAMEDSGTLQSLTFLNQGGRMDLQRCVR